MQQRVRRRVPARFRERVGSGEMFLIGTAAAFGFVVAVWLLMAIGQGARSVPDGPPAVRPDDIATSTPAPIVMATTASVFTPTAVPTATAPPTPIVVVVTHPPQVVVAQPPPAPTLVPARAAPTATTRVNVIVKPVPTLPPPSPAAMNARMGQRVESGGVVVSAASAVRESQVPPAFPVRAGRSYVVVDVTLENVRVVGNLPFSPGDFRLRDDSGREYEAALPSGDAGSLRGGQLAPGGNTGGQVVFEVPATARGFVLGYSPPVALPGFSRIAVDLGA